MESYLNSWLPWEILATPLQQFQSISAFSARVTTHPPPLSPWQTALETVAPMPGVASRPRVGQKDLVLQLSEFYVLMADYCF